jgi:hypothetical protein
MLLKEEDFFWTWEETKKIEKIKEAICTIPILTTDGFTKTLIMECDASRHNISAILMQ